MWRCGLLVASLVAADLSLSGCGKSGRVGSPVIVRTVSDHTGVAMPDIRVQVTGQGWTTTDSTGEAEFSGVSTPFTVSVHQDILYSGSTVETGEAVFVREGQSASEVVVEVDGDPGSLDGPPRTGWHRASVSGSVAGLPGSPSGVTWVQVSCRGMWQPAVVAADGTFDLGVLFEDGASSVNVRAFAGTPGPSNHVTRLDGVGSAKVLATAGGHESGVALALAPVAESTVNGTVALPPALAGADLAARWSLGYGRYEADSVSRISTPVDAAGFTLSVPVVAAAETWVAVRVAGAVPPSSGTHARRLTPPASSVTFQVPEPAQLLEPASDATVDHATLFRWSGGEAGGSFTLEVACAWTVGSTTRTMSYHVTTQATQATLPEIADFALAAGAACTWSVSWTADTDVAVEQRWSRSTLRTATTQ